jgi:protein TonB
MAPSAIVDKHEVSDCAGVSPALEFLPIPARTPEPIRTRRQVDVPVLVNKLFASALIEQNHITGRSRALDVAISVVLHITIIGMPVLASLYYTDTINLKQFAATMLVAPPPPAPPPPPASAVMKRVPVHRVFMKEGRLVAPRYVPEKVAELKETPIPEDTGAGVAGGVPGGVPGGQIGGVIGGIIGGLSKDAGPLAPPSKPKAPIRVGGHIRAPRALFQPAPVYPIIAKQARVSGAVVIDAVLDEKGNVLEMKVLSGPPLLYGAALQALKEWKYEPTYLNDTAISVQMIVTVTFQLTGL